MTTKARDGDVERSRKHVGRTDVENTDSGCEPRGPGVRGVNTPEQDMFRQKSIRGKNDQRLLQTAAQFSTSQKRCGPFHRKHK